MKKNKKRYNKGFLLVETLIATVFVSAIFVIIYMNFYPLVGEYEKRENYEEIDTIYQTFWMKYLITNSSSFDELCKEIDNELNEGDNGYYLLTFDKINSILPSSKKDKFNQLYNNNYSKVKKIIIVSCNNDQLSDIKEMAYETSDLEELSDYIESLPRFCIKDNQYKMIVEYEKKYKTGTKENSTYISFVNLDFSNIVNRSDDEEEELIEEEIEDDDMITDDSEGGE